MGTKLPDDLTDGEFRVADQAVESTIGSAETVCAACGAQDGGQQLLLTVDWVDYLVEEYDTRAPEEECVVPLCSRCRSLAETLEIAEMNADRYGRAERETILAERNRFLDSLRVELISNFTVSEPMRILE